MIKLLEKVLEVVVVLENDKIIRKRKTDDSLWPDLHNKIAKRCSSFLLLVYM